MAEQFKRSNDESGVAFIQTGELQDKATVVKLRLLRIKYAADQPGYVHFSTISFIGSADFTGPTCHVVNPDKVDFLDGAPHLRFETEALVASVRLWWDALGIHKPPLCTFRSGNVPYPGVNGLPLYVAEGTETSGPAALGGGGGGGGGGSIAEVAVTCPVCSEEWVPSAMRQHIGFRLLHEPERVPATYPCGFCGRESAQFSSDLSQLSGCAVWLSRGSQRCTVNSWVTLSTALPVQRNPARLLRVLIGPCYARSAHLSLVLSTGNSTCERALAGRAQQRHSLSS